MGNSGACSDSGSMPDKWDEYIKDVDIVQNPNDGGNIYIDNQYNHAWINSARLRATTWGRSYGSLGFVPIG